MKIIAGIVLFYPDIVFVNQNIKTLLHQVDEIVLLDNTPNSKGINLICPERVHYISNGDNYGIAYALNQIARFAESIQAEWFITFDQDTLIPQDLVFSMIESYGLGRNERIGIVCPCVEDIKTGSIEPKLNHDKYVNRCITSGSMTFLAAYNEIGGFDNELFIDEVDHDFCYKLKLNGWKILQSSKSIIKHSLGDIEHRTLFGRVITVRNYSAFRKYYQARNRIILARRYDLESNLSAAIRIGYWILVCLLFEKEKINGTKSLIKGMRDGIKRSRSEIMS
ncbi:glycosyltransferase family 2 protein [Collinsella tanakaei]|uniref:glycosyltransferase family 2 protein n=1 Tax=Collinsella tanakaei TaxID=626935 RepID=UPI0025A40AAF|nr:glycosyltransferase family 2 protein [Collinsella tanakaei]MDM8246385.1 glycosyltransferase family 2 protein [Collinsella tanakaei]